MAAKADHDDPRDDSWVPSLDELRSAQQGWTLSLSGRPLSGLPPEIGQLTHLRQLFLDNTGLAGLPYEIGRLTHLRLLNLDRNGLTQVPPGIVHLANLQRLDMDRNRLTGLPPEIGRLTRLEQLFLNGNELTSLPPEIGQLTNLRVLDLAGNHLTELPPEIGRLTNLQVLYLDGNPLAGLPAEIGHLTGLQQLFLDNTGLTGLPPEVVRLANLHRLDLNGNGLTSLPPALAPLLRGGLTLAAAGNPLHDPLPELLDSGADALAAYLSSVAGLEPTGQADEVVAQHDTVALYEAKVLLVGEGGVGKTALSAALREEPFVDGRETTHGIEISTLALRHPHLDVDMALRIWDFGGQEVYRITHQFFFSRRALYLMVWKPREGREQNEVEGWLRRIRLRVRDQARVLVVATHADERFPDLDYPYLQRLFPKMLAGQFAVDNASGTGIDALRQAIATEAAGLPHMGGLLSPRWIAARDKVLALAEKNPQITYDQFADIAIGSGLTDDEVRFLAELLHVRGQVIYYGDDEGLRDIVVLNPEWLTKAISYVLEDKPTREGHGVLHHARLKEIWRSRQDGYGYPERYHPYFLRLMERFDVSYRLEDPSDASLVAQLVPHERPALPWDAATAVPDAIRRLRLICRLSEPAPGLVAWLTVRHHAASTNRHWRRGVFLRYPVAAYASEALLDMPDDRTLLIEVRAPSPDFLANVLRDSVENLIGRRWPGLAYRLLVPCPTVNPEGTGCPGTFPLDGLLGRRERSGLAVACLECQADHDVAELLTGFAAPATALPAELDRLHSEMQRVAGSIERVENHLADHAATLRWITTAISAEVTDCPRLFTLEPIRRTFVTRRYSLTLWCEFPGYWHPQLEARYELRKPREWLVDIAPYAKVVVRVLRLGVHVGAAALGVALPAGQLDQMSGQIEVMSNLIDAVPDSELQNGGEVQTSEAHVSTAPTLTAAQGQGLRGLRALLMRLDTTRAFGGLRRVQAPSGEFLWVCPEHYRSYDPGLPAIPIEPPPQPPLDYSQRPLD